MRNKDIYEHTLVNLTDIDVSNLSKWSDQWLDKLNPDKTDIMYSVLETATLTRILEN